MTKKEWIKQHKLLSNKIKSVEFRLEWCKKQYIEANAPYPIGTKVKIEYKGIIKDAVISGYKINKNSLEPQFNDLNGKKLYTFEPTIIGEL